MKKAIILVWTLLLLSACSQDDTVPIDETPYEWVTSHTIDELFDLFDDTEISVDTIAITGIVISSDESGNISNELYISDETGALVLLLEGDNLFENFPMGSEVLLKCLGLVPDKEKRSLSLPDGGSLILEELGETIISTGETTTVAAEYVSPLLLSDEHLNQYLRFSGYQFPESAVGETYIQNGEGTTWELTNVNDESISLVFDANVSFANELISDKAGLVKGLYVKGNNGNIIKVISLDDLEFTSNRRAPFEKQTFQFGDNSLPYQIMFPRDYDPTEKYPLVIFLHGAGERGTNNTSQMAYGPTTFGSYEARTDYPAIVIFPQCPSDVMWSRRIKYTNDQDVLIFEFPVEAEPNYAMEMVIELVRSMIENEGVDANRIYITGLSMGGIGTYEFMYYAPDLAAAGISMAGGHDPELLASYGINLAFRLYHGSDDSVVPARYSQGMYDKMVELGITAMYTEAEGRGHEWSYVLSDPEYLEWMFSQSKQ